METVGRKMKSGLKRIGSWYRYAEIREILTIILNLRSNPSSLDSLNPVEHTYGIF
jgi:hypothetical protein